MVLQVKYKNKVRFLHFYSRINCLVILPRGGGEPTEGGPRGGGPLGGGLLLLSLPGGGPRAGGPAGGGPRGGPAK